MTKLSAIKGDITTAEDEAAKISIDVCKQNRYKDMQIYFYLFQDETFNRWNNLINKLKGHAF